MLRSGLTEEESRWWVNRSEEGPAQPRALTWRAACTSEGSLSRGGTWPERRGCRGAERGAWGPRGVAT